MTTYDKFYDELQKYRRRELGMADLSEKAQRALREAFNKLMGNRATWEELERDPELRETVVTNAMRGFSP